MEENTCGDCGVKEGELHEYGCDMEDCPFCGDQLLGCDCMYKELNLFDETKYNKETGYLPKETYYDGLNKKQELKWEKILNEKGRHTYIEYPLMCAKCSKLWPEFFMVPNEEWKQYIQPSEQDKVICLNCYTFIKKVTNKYKKEK